VRATSQKTGTEKIVMTHAYVPDPSVAAGYVGRKVWGIYDKILADTARAEAANMLLEGETGAGKTLFGEAYASHERLAYYSLPCDVSIDPSSLFGRRNPGKKAGEFPWTDGPVTSIVRHGGVLNISEINFMTPKISASLYPLLDGRRYIPLLGHEGEVVRAHKGGGKTGDKCWCNLTARECDSRRVLIIADMNPFYRGTMELNAAFRNRFEFKIPWNYDAAVGRLW
jgi:MoxR-like ATPase